MNATHQLIAAAAVVLALALFGLGICAYWIATHRSHLTAHQRRMLFGEEVRP